MGSCDEILELISAALDGPLSEADQAALDAHLAICPACSALFQDLSALHAAASALEEVPAPEGFAADVMARISAEAEQADNVTPFPRKVSRSHWKRWSATAAVVAVVALGAITLPGQMGGRGTMTADTNGAAAPQAVEECADSSAIEAFDGEAGESEAFNSTTASAPALFSAQKDAAVESATGSSDSLTKQEPAPATRSAAGSYCAVLTLGAEELPDDLEQYESFAEDGARYYLIPAEEFYALAQDLDADMEELDPDGEYGLLRVPEG